MSEMRKALEKQTVIKNFPTNIAEISEEMFCRGYQACAASILAALPSEDEVEKLFPNCSLLQFASIIAGIQFVINRVKEVCDAD